jgi:predicted nucleic acid-binding protein
LIGSFTGQQETAAALRKLLDRGEVAVIPAIVLYEWLRGPRIRQEIDLQEALFPAEAALPFGPEEAMVSANVYRKVARPQGREMDLAIAACAIAREIPLWTLNRKDFADIPGLTLASIH